MTYDPRKKHRSSQRGTALIEFALVLPILLALTLAGIDLGRAFLAKNVLHQAAREGVRMRVRMPDPNAAELDSVVRRVQMVAGSGGFVRDSVMVNTYGPDPVTKLDYVEVTARFTFTFPLLFNVVGMNITNPMPLTAVCYMKQE